MQSRLKYLHNYVMELQFQTHHENADQTIQLSDSSIQSNIDNIQVVRLWNMFQATT